MQGRLTGTVVQKQPWCDLRQRELSRFRDKGKFSVKSGSSKHSIRNFLREAGAMVGRK